MSNIHKTAIVEEGAIIGENVTIGAYTIIGSNVTIGNGTIIGSNTVIEGKTGWLLPPKDPVLWAHNIEKALGLSDSERKKMAKTARAHVETHFSSVAMIQKTVAVYETLMKGTHKRIRVSKK